MTRAYVAQMRASLLDALQTGAGKRLFLRDLPDGHSGGLWVTDAPAALARLGKSERCVALVRRLALLGFGVTEEAGIWRIWPDARRQAAFCRALVARAARLTHTAPPVPKEAICLQMRGLWLSLGAVATADAVPPCEQALVMCLMRAHSGQSALWQKRLRARAAVCLRTGAPSLAVAGGRALALCLAYAATH